MHPKRRFFVRAVVLLALSFTGLIHAQVKTTGKVPALEQLEKVGVYIEAQHHAEHPGLQGYYEDRATEWRRFNHRSAPGAVRARTVGTAQHRV
jgi:hypothetical protein